MTTTSEHTRVTAAARRPWGLITAASLLAAGTIVLIWVAAVPWGPLVCPAVYPAPTNCFASHRVGTGVVASIGVGVLYLATLLVAVIGGRRRSRWVAVGVFLLALAPIVAYLLVAWLPGFLF